MPHAKSVEDALITIKSDPSKILGLTVGSHTITTPGQKVPKADAQSPPILTLPPLISADGSKTYMVIGLDLDAPFASFAILGPVLHWIQPGLTASSSTALTSTAPFVANYIGPAPPPPSGPHRYIFLLYEQPEGFVGENWAPPGGKPLGIWGRAKWNLTEFEKKTGLGSVVAANYFASN